MSFERAEVVPSDWLDEELLVELCFVAAPDDAGRAAIATALERSARGGALIAGRWLWAERHALLELGEAFREPGHTFRDDLPPVLRAIDAVAPLVYATFVGAGAHGIVPRPGPRWGGWAAHRTTRPGEGPWVGDPDDAFEVARTAAARVAIADAEDARRAQASDGSLQWIPVADVAGVPPRIDPRRARSLAGSAADALTLPPRCVAVAPDGTVAIADACELHLLDRRGHRRFKADFVDLLAFVADGRGLIVGMTGRELPTIVLGLRDGVIRELDRFDVEVAGPHRAVGDHDGRILASAGFALVGFAAAWAARFADDGAAGDDALELA